MKKMNKLDVLSWIVAVVNLIISVLYILQLPEIVPTHFNMNWVCDGMGSRWTAMLTAILPLAFCVCYPISKKYVQKENAKHSGILWLATELYLIVIHWAMLILSMGSGVQLGQQLDSAMFAWVLLGAIGLLYVVMGNYMPVIQQNHMLGFRLKWTLENEACWRVTHRFAGKMLVICGICLLTFLFLAICLGIPMTWGLIALFLTVCISCVVTSIYAYQHRDDKN